MFEEDMKCRVCEKENSYEDEKHTFEECSEILPSEERNCDIRFAHIFGTLEEQIKSIQYFSKIIKKRDILLDIK